MLPLQILTPLMTEPVIPSGVAVTPEMLQPVVTGFSANVGVIIPYAIALFSIMIGLKMIPKLFKAFMAG